MNASLCFRCDASCISILESNFESVDHGDETDFEIDDEPYCESENVSAYMRESVEVIVDAKIEANHNIREHVGGDGYISIYFSPASPEFGFCYSLLATTNDKYNLIGDAQ